VKRLLLVLAVPLVALTPGAGAGGGRTIALVTAETVNQLVAVDLPSGRIVKRLQVPDDPQNVAVCGRTAAVVSVRAGAVTLVDTNTLRIRRVIRGFASPHIPACSRDGRTIYVTDDARGQLAAIRDDRVVSKLFVGSGAHHIAVSPDQPRLWIALGERATSIVIVDTTNATHPRVAGRVDPHGFAHDLTFGPGGRRVWVTYDVGLQVRIFDAAAERPLKTIYGGSPPQHVAFNPYSRHDHAYVSSGDDGTLRVFSLPSARLLRTARLPGGSFNVTTFGSFVVTSSLTNGTLTELSDSGRILLSKRVAPAARDVAVAVVP
jgi:DNA-binding beta-propeller fold protein YncE